MYIYTYIYIYVCVCVCLLLICKVCYGYLRYVHIYSFDSFHYVSMTLLTLYSIQYTDVGMTYSMTRRKK